MATTTRLPALSVSDSRNPNTSLPLQSRQQQQLPSSFWEDIHQIRTNSFEYIEPNVWGVTTTVAPRNTKHPQKHGHIRKRKWTFRSRKSHILDTNGHYAWKRELNCFQGQSLPDAVFPENTLEILFNSDGGSNSDDDDDDDSDSESLPMRIRFGALEGLRGWMSLDSAPIPTTDARDNAHWKNVALHDQLPDAEGRNILGRYDGGSISSTSYDYAYTTPYKGGTDNNGNDTHSYGYLKADSTSFVPRHDAETNDVPAARTGIGSLRAGIQRPKVKLRKPICKCKGDGGRAPFVSSSSDSSKSSKPNTNTTTNTDRPKSQSQKHRYRHNNLSPPRWKPVSYKVDIEGMLSRAAQKSVHPFLFREDVDLWQDDLHDNGVAWLKARCFVCQEGWACLLRNFVRVDGVLCRVVDTRYIHTFGTSAVYREHSWREGPWDILVRAMGPQQSGYPGATTTRRPPPPPPPHGSSPVSLQSINDSIAARYLPLVKPPRTECLSLEDPLAVRTLPSTLDCGMQQQQQQLVMINDATIEDGIPVPNFRVESELGISFVLKRAKGTRLEAISSSTYTAGEADVRSGGSSNSSSPSFPISSLWSKRYEYSSGESEIESETSNSHSNSNSDKTTITPHATILTVRISPDPSDGGRLAIGDDRGYVQVWRLATGDFLWRFPVAPLSIRNRSERNPKFQSARLWVDHLAWSGDGSRLGASAGRNTVMVQAIGDSDSDSDVVPGRILSTLESTSGTVTGLAFRNNHLGLPGALAVASYGEIRWLTAPTSKEKPNSEHKGGSRSDMDSDCPEPLKREGAAVECIAISPNGKKVAVGFLDKTLRVYTLNTESRSSSDNGGSSAAATTMTSITHMPSSASPGKRREAIVDWVGFNAAVKSVCFSPAGTWLAAMGGNSLLVISNALDPRTEAPIVCRTPGQTEADGCDGTCHRFADIRWSTGGDSNSIKNNASPSQLLAALDAKTGGIHVFCFSRDGRNNGTENHCQHDAWPIRALPVLTVLPTFRKPSPFVKSQFAFFSAKTASIVREQEESNNPTFLVLDRSVATADEDASSTFNQELGSKLTIGLPHTAILDESGDDASKNESFSFRIVL